MSQAIATLLAETPGRATCYRCFRPTGFCLCGIIPAVDNRTPVVILQHPRERTHPFGTARLVALGLRHAEVLVDHVGCLRRGATTLGSLEGAALLYPSAHARDVTTLAPAEHPRRLFVIDGTWHQAKTLYRDIPALATLPHLTLPGHLRSGFQIRRQPDVHCLSTIEAIVFTLRALEPETPGLTELLGVFAAMQAQQLALPRNAGRQHKAVRQRASRAIPRSLIEGHAKLVVAYVESTFEPEHPEQRRLLCCAAERLATGERFYRVIRQSGLHDAHLDHLGLERSAVDSGVSPEEFRSQWSEFLGSPDNLATWNQNTLDLLCGALGGPLGGVALKAAYHNLKRFRGSLEEIVKQEGLPPRNGAALVGGGRAGLRLENAVQLACFLHERGSGGAPFAA